MNCGRVHTDGKLRPIQPRLPPRAERNSIRLLAFHLIPLTLLKALAYEDGDSPPCEQPQRYQQKGTAYCGISHMYYIESQRLTDRIFSPQWLP